MNDLPSHLFTHYPCSPKEECNAENHYHKCNDRDSKSLVIKYLCDLFLRSYVLLTIREVGSLTHHVKIIHWTLCVNDVRDLLLVCNKRINNF